MPIVQMKHVPIAVQKYPVQKIVQKDSIGVPAAPHVSQIAVLLNAATMVVEEAVAHARTEKNVTVECANQHAYLLVMGIIAVMMDVVVVVGPAAGRLPVLMEHALAHNIIQDYPIAIHWFVHQLVVHKEHAHYLQKGNLCAFVIMAGLVQVVNVKMKKENVVQSAHHVLQDKLVQRVHLNKRVHVLIRFVVGM